MLIGISPLISPELLALAPVTGDHADPSVHDRYRAAIDKHQPGTPPVAFVPRFDFYERARRAFAVVATGDTKNYGNVLLKKGVTPVSQPAVRAGG